MSAPGAKRTLGTPGTTRIIECRNKKKYMKGKKLNRSQKRQRDKGKGKRKK